MPAIKIEFRIDDQATRAAFRRLIRAGSHPAPLLRAFGEALLRSTQERMSAQKAPDGSTWAPLHPWTRETKRHSKILTENPQAGLAATIRYQLDGARRVRVGSDKVYSRIHQYGGIIRPVMAPALAIPRAGGGVRLVQKVTIPARPYLGISTDDRRELQALVGEYVHRMLRG